MPYSNKVSILCIGMRTMNNMERQQKKMDPALAERANVCL